MDPRLLLADFAAKFAHRLGMSRRYLLPLVGLPRRKSGAVVLVLCQGNICRSPYAAARLGTLLRERGISEVVVRSAGLATENGKPADPMAVKIASERGIDLTAHHATSATDEMLRSADLILIMDSYQRAAVRRLAAGASKKTMYLGALLLEHGYPLFINDPFGHPPDIFHACFRRIDEALDKLVEHLHAAAHSA